MKVNKKDLEIKTEIITPLCDTHGESPGTQIEKALNFYHLSDGRYSFLMFNPSAEGCMTERSGLLEGPAGVAMALLQETTPLSRWLLFD